MIPLQTKFEQQVNSFKWKSHKVGNQSSGATKFQIDGSVTQQLELPSGGDVTVYTPVFESNKYSDVTLNVLNVGSTSISLPINDQNPDTSFYMISAGNLCNMVVINNLDTPNLRCQSFRYSGDHFTTPLLNYKK